MRKHVLALIATVVSGCGSNMSGGPPGTLGGTGGSPNTGGSPGTDVAGMGGATPDAGTPVAPVECLEHPAARTVPTTPISIKVELSYAGSPVTFGEPFAIDGGTLTLTNLRFYISNPALRLPTGGDVPVDLMAGDGALAPYGVVLVNAEDPSAMTFQIAAPAGDYSGLSFLVGIPDACNGVDYGRSPPLSAISQMTWPPPFGYLFLRYAGKRGEGTPTDATPGAIDMGGFPRQILAPRIWAESDLRISSARTVRLTVALDQLFRAVGMPADLGEYAQILSAVPGLGNAQMNGQHLLQNLGAVAAFTITDLP